MSFSPPSFPTTTPTGALGMNEVVGILKEIYNGQVVEAMTYRDNPFLAMVRKDTQFLGKQYPLPVIVDASTGRSATFSYAQTNQNPMPIVEFMLQRVSDYSIATITNEAMLAARADIGSFIRSTKAVVDQAIQACANSLASALFRSGTGTIGQSNGMSTGVITLADPNSVVNFAVGQVLQANATDGGTPRVALGYVIKINRAAGQITVSATANGNAGNPNLWSTGANGDYLLVQGDNNAKVTGLAGWLNAANVASNDSFFSVNRSSDVTRLAGVYYNGSAQSIEEALIDASSLLAREGGRPDVCVMSYSSYSALEKGLGARAVYVDWEGPANIAFRGIEINGANSRIKCFPDRNCPGLTAYLLTMDTWVLASADQAPMILKYNDGLEMLRVYNADAAELRVGYYAQLGCSAPGHNAQVVLSA